MSPQRFRYDEAWWRDLNDLDAVGPWREADRMAAINIAASEAAAPPAIAARARGIERLLGYV